jgi:hypothetical protein
MANKFCEACGTPIEEGAKFCPSCGKVTATTQAPPPPVQQYHPPVQNYAPPVQQQYIPPQQNYYQKTEDTTPMTVGQYIVMFLLLCIPIAQLILPFVWAFGSNVNVNKKNLARAILIFAGIAFVLYIIILVIFGAALFSSFKMGGSYGNY